MPYADYFSNKLDRRRAQPSDCLGRCRHRVHRGDLLRPQVELAEKNRVSEESGASPA